LDTKYRPGALVRVRDRDWVVQPSPDTNLVLLKPLGGSDDEITGIFLPLRFSEDAIESTNFPMPTGEDIGDISSARLLYNATRLSFRSGAGPFRSLAKLSFRPRSYQMVPLIMALRQEKPIRLFIADDVGVGKTIEALAILKELLERREISRFAIVVLPHLCEQWQMELKDKFGIDAVIIRSNTQARLDREIQGDRSVYSYYPYQIISIDYIKSEQRREVFIKQCPELVIVDEVHTCAEPTGSQYSNQQQRYSLIRDIAAKKDQNLILLTATPHSGKPEQFRSLISLLNPDYINLDLPSASHDKRKEFAQYYVQRRRGDIERWLGEDTPFPKRDSGEIAYDVSKKYHELYLDVVEFALGITKKEVGHKGKMRMRYWSALALLRGIMSSPSAGIEMLQNRIKKTDGNEELTGSESEENPLIDDDFDTEKDYPSAHVIDRTDWTDSEIKKMQGFSKRLEEVQGINHDAKAADVVTVVESWLRQGFHPVLFCRYIATANYLGAILKQELTRRIEGLNIQVVTSEDPDEVRKTRIDDISVDSPRVLVATDCLSEGINLQDKFTAVLHYDLPWNPNRLEQREGRVDRFGQTARTVKAYLYYGKNNPIDGVVLKVLLRKVQEIRKATGISIPFPEDSKSLMDSVMQAVLLSREDKAKGIQQSLDFGEFNEVSKAELEVSHAIEKAADREKASRTIFAQHSIKAEEIEDDLKESDEAIGSPKTVENFVVDALNTILGVQITKDKKAYVLYTTNLPESLKTTLPVSTKLKVTFYSPSPEGYLYLGRNHAFVEQLCQYLMSNAMNNEKMQGPKRASVIRCRDVSEKTTLLLFRVRNVIQEKSGTTQLVAEEMLVWGYEGSPQHKKILSNEIAIKLLDTAVPTANMSDHERKQWLSDELATLNVLHTEFDKVAMERAQELVDAHERFRKVLAGSKYKVVEPILPMDLIGVYILLPDNMKR
jgi:superfamily II DNA or RNA helicase